jgi:hypothetical protein
MEFERKAVCQAMDICNLVLPVVIAARFRDGSFGTETLFDRSQGVRNTVIEVLCLGKLGWAISNKCVFENPSAECRKSGSIEEQIKELGSQAKKDTGPDLSQFTRF